MTQFTLDALDLAALLSSRVCHDVSSPVGAIVNGLEVLEEEKDPEMRGHALALIKSSANEASSRLQFCRLAFGAAGSKGASIDTGDAELVTRQFLADERTQQAMFRPFPVMKADAAIPRGGMISVAATGEEDKISLRVEAKGVNARLAANVAPLLAGQAEECSIDARAIQAYYTGLIAKACDLELSASCEGDVVSFDARPTQASATVDETDVAPSSCEDESSSQTTHTHRAVA